MLVIQTPATLLLALMMLAHPDGGGSQWQTFLGVSALVCLPIALGLLLAVTTTVASDGALILLVLVLVVQDVVITLGWVGITTAPGDTPSIAAIGLAVIVLAAVVGPAVWNYRQRQLSAGAEDRLPT